MTLSRRLDDGRTRRRIVQLLKTEGAMDSATLAARLQVTPMAVRQHLYSLQDEKLVRAEERPVPLGRPAKHWQLTPEANRLFPDAYAELNVSLIRAVEQTFGANAISQLLQTRLAAQRTDYAARIDRGAPLGRKLQQLARIRSEEGYMAEVRREAAGSFLFVENHCPICAAATACQGFCATELDLFQSALGPEVTIERAEHIVAGDRRCAYRVQPRSGVGPRSRQTVDAKRPAHRRRPRG